MRFLTIFFFVFIAMIGTVNAQRASDNWLSKSEKLKKANEIYEQGIDAEYDENYDLAITNYDDALALNPGNAEMLMTRGQCKELVGDYIGALTDYEAVVRISPQNKNAYFKRAWLYYRQKRYEAAIRDFTFLIQDHDARGEGTTSIIFTGVEFNEGGNTMMTGVTTIDRLKSDAFNGRALSYGHLEDYEAAYRDYNSAIEANGDEPNYYVNRGLLSKKRGWSERAINDFRTALSIFSGHKAALYNLSLLVDEEEVEGLNEGLHASGDFAAAYSKRGYEKYLVNDFRGALADYDSALNLRPKFAEDLMNRGLIHAKLGAYRSAIEDYEQVLELKPELTRVYVKLGNAHQELKQFDLAIQFYSLYLTLEGPEAMVYYNRGIASHRLRNKKMACDDLTAAVSLGLDQAKKALSVICAD